MYLGIDIGGTKTLVAVLSEGGEIVAQRRFATAQEYGQFLGDLEINFQQLSGQVVQIKPATQSATQLSSDSGRSHNPQSASPSTLDFLRCVAGVPGHINRETGVVYALGNLPWRDKPIRDDLAAIVGQSVVIENDSRLAGLSEAQLVKDQYRTVLFATVSTGIGGGLIRDGYIVPALRDMEIGKMPLWYRAPGAGQATYRHWEDFASGRALVERFGKRADEVTDPADWQAVAEPLAYGLAAVCSTLQPDIIILGGSVGKHTAKFSPYIVNFLAAHLHANVSRPKAIVPARRPDEAVIYGCYDLAQQLYAGQDKE